MSLSEDTLLILKIVLTLLAFIGLLVVKKQIKKKKAALKASLQIPAQDQNKTPLPTPSLTPVQIPIPVLVPETPKWTDKLKSGLRTSRQEIWGKIFGSVSTQEWDRMEELLYSADVGSACAQEILDFLKKRLGSGANEEQLKGELFAFLKDKLGPIQKLQGVESLQFDPQNPPPSPVVIMIVGINGVGKTTTIGKLAAQLTGLGAKVTVGAGDTFRAAAVDQLQVWCDRAGAQMVRAPERSAPSGVGYTALQSALQNQSHYCLLDTAGRLHTKGNLMEELNKSKNVLSKLVPSAPHHVWLVLDAVTGQNALRQAQEFHRTLGVTGLIFTKCDGSSKAGAGVGIISELKVPITYIGVGEGVQDLQVFNLDEYLSALLGTV